MGRQSAPPAEVVPIPYCAIHGAELAGIYRKAAENEHNLAIDAQTVPPPSSSPQ